MFLSRIKELKNNKVSEKIRKIALPLGLLFNAIPGILRHTTGLPDFWAGFFHGLGITMLLLVAVLYHRNRTS